MCGRAQRNSFLLLFSLVCAFFVSHSVSAQGPGMATPVGAASRAQAALSARSALPARETRLPGDSWVPPDIDHAKLSVDAGAACSLPDVLDRAGRRVQELVANLDRFTATEFVEHQSVSGAGKLAKVKARKFDYVVSIGPSPGGYFSVQEYRSRVPNAEQFPDQIATEGTPSLVLVFHPTYARDFDMKCEGLGAWQGHPAWQVRFEQRRDRVNRMSNVVVKNKMYSVRLRGRAWILADSYQVARLETDLADTIPAIKLRLEHMNVEYRPVTFPERRAELWLPASAELFLDFADRRFYRKHSFTNFTLFSVDVNQQLADGTSLTQQP
jgi:hypothetical protein